MTRELTTVRLASKMHKDISRAGDRGCMSRKGADEESPGSHVNPIRSKTETRAVSLPGSLSGGSLEAAGDGGPR